MKIMLAQLNPLVGDIHGNTGLALHHIEVARAAGVELLVFPELFLCGYPPEDLLLRPSLKGRIEWALGEIAAALNGGNLHVIIGYPRITDRGCTNVAGVFDGTGLIMEYAKRKLPNYRVFDEKRYFVEGDASGLVEIAGIRFGLTICEDLWHPDPVRDARAAGAQVILNINASPWHTRKYQMRTEVIDRRVRESGLPILYLNMVGGQDELVFDGASLAVNGDGERVFQAGSFVTETSIIELELAADGVHVLPGELAPVPELPESLYLALVASVHDYVTKNGFGGVILGLSGGIDSALTLAVAVDALGAERVEAVMLPYRYTSELSQNVAAEQARRMGVRYRSIRIDPMVEAFTAALAEEFRGLPADKTEENIQARCRGVVIMSISNKKGYLVLTTGNKSELAVGYATLYGDMAGGFDVLKDVTKTRVYELARYRNSLGPVIPEDVISRSPSAELAPGQTDQDSLPPYDQLDRILELYIEQDCSAEDIIGRGFDRDWVTRVLRMVDLNEYKRRQAPIGPRLTQRAFGRDRRYPITNGWRLGD